MSEALKRIEDYRNEILKNLYNQCTGSQQNLFNRMYGNIENLIKGKDIHGKLYPKEEVIRKIEWAIQQCERTILKNNLCQK